MSNRERIRAAIAELRNARGLSTRQLSKLSGVHFANIGKLERGEYNSSIDIVEKILKPLGAELVIKIKEPEGEE